MSELVEVNERDYRKFEATHERAYRVATLAARLIGPISLGQIVDYTKYLAEAADLLDEAEQREFR